MKGSKVALANAAAKIQSAGTGVAALDSAHDTLTRARAAVAQTPLAHVTAAPFGTAIDALTGTLETRLRDLLDSIETVEGRLVLLRSRFRGYTGDDLDQEISTLLSMQIANALQRALAVYNDAMDWLNDPPNFDLVGGIVAAIETAIGAAVTVVNNAAQGAANLAAGLASAFWVPLVVAAGGVLLVIAWRQGLLKKIG